MGQMTLSQILSQRIFWELILIYWGFSALVGALPSPTVVSQYVKQGVGLLIYSTFFAFLHLLSGTVTRAAQAFKVPGASAVVDAEADAGKADSKGAGGS